MKRRFPCGGESYIYNAMRVNRLGGRETNTIAGRETNTIAGRETYTRSGRAEHR